LNNILMHKTAIISILQLCYTYNIVTT